MYVSVQWHKYQVTWYEDQVTEDEGETSISRVLVMLLQSEDL